MALRNLVVASEMVKVSGGEGFAVRGLSPHDVMGLFMRHRGEMSSLFDSYAAKAAEKQQDTSEIASFLLGNGSDFLTEIVMVASGSVIPDPLGAAEALWMEWEADYEVARKLPLGAQADALAKIATLTFSADMPPGKFIGVALGLMQKATGLTNPKP